MEYIYLLDFREKPILSKFSEQQMERERSVYSDTGSNGNIFFKKRITYKSKI